MNRDKQLTLAAATLGGLETQQWIVNAYLLMLGSLILIGGSLGDVALRRRTARGRAVRTRRCVRRRHARVDRPED